MNVFAALGFLLVIVGIVLLSHLGNSRGAGPLRRLARRWVESGREARSFNSLLWGLFTLVAVAFFTLVGMALVIGVSGVRG